LLLVLSKRELIEGKRLRRGVNKPDWRV